MIGLFEELKRRNVFRVGAAYVAFAWVILQAADVFFDLLAVPDWAGKTLVAVLTVGFPVALMLAWAFEFTPEGLKLERDVDRSAPMAMETGRKLDRIIIAVLAVAVGLLLVDKFVLQQETGDPTVAGGGGRASIAVLPFANLSRDETNEPFAAGIHDDLLTHISKISAIKTISRTSVLRFKDTEKPIPDIGRELGVATVLEGGVQRAGNQVRINVQLIDAVTDEHLWAETYDRELTAVNIFAIQSEIATAIAAELQATLTRAERERVSDVPTENLAAYEAYLLGRQRMVSRRTEDLDSAERYFKEAVELDPGFALAWVGLAETYSLLDTYSGRPGAVLKRARRQAVENALALDDQLGEAHISRAFLYEDEGEPEKVEAAYRLGLKLNPNYASGYHWYGGFLSHVGRYDEAFVQYNKALELDPLSPIIRTNYGDALASVGRYNDSLVQFKKAVEIEPKFAQGYIRLGTQSVFEMGRYDKGIPWMIRAVELDPGFPALQALIAFSYADLGDFESSAYWVSRALEIGPREFWPNVAKTYEALRENDDAVARLHAERALAAGRRGRQPLSLLRTLDLRAGDPGRALERYRNSHPKLLNDAEPVINANNFGVAVDLARVLQLTGDPERARLLLERALDFIRNVPRGGFGGKELYDVQAYALLGETQMALDLLTEAVDGGWRVGLWQFVNVEPNIETLRDEPRYKDLVALVARDMEQQLVTLKTAESGPGKAP